MLTKTCIFGFIINNSLEYLKSGKDNKEYWKKDQHISLISLIKNFFYTFKKEDECYLFIASEDKEEDWGKINAWLDKAEWEHLHHHLPIVKLLDKPLLNEQDKQAFQAECDILLNDKIWAMPYLFHLYTQHIGVHKLQGTERSTVIDLYDSSYIVAIRRHHPHYIGGMELQLYDAMIDFLQWQQAQTWLDVGCGSGLLYGVLKNYSIENDCYFPHYCGIDNSRGQIIRAQKNYPDGHFILADATQMIYPDKYFDVAIANAFFAELLPAQGVSALKEILRVSRQGIFATIRCYSNVIEAIPEKLEYRFFNGERFVRYFFDIDDIMAIYEAHHTIMLQKEHGFLLYRNDRANIEVTEKGNKTSYDNFLAMFADVKKEKNQHEGDVQKTAITVRVDGYSGINWRVYQYIDCYIYPKNWYLQRFSEVVHQEDILSCLDAKNIAATQNVN